MKNFILIFAMLLLPAAGFAQSGTIGSLNWALAGDTLTISGTGAMPDYSAHYDTPLPWGPYSESITAVILKSGVTTIGSNTFASGCTHLTSITVDAGNPFYTSNDGVLFNKDMTILILCPIGKTGDYYIPGSVTSIGDNAFRYCFRLTAVIIPNSVKSIGKQVFTMCTGLTSIAIPYSVTRMAALMFNSCENLTDITVGWETAIPSIDVSVFGAVSITFLVLHVPPARKGFTGRLRPGKISNG
jgi:hypothetical protein